MALPVLPVAVRCTRAGRPLATLLRRPVQAGLVAVATVLVTTLTLTALVLTVLAPREARADDVLEALRDAHVAMIDQETGLRGFLLTREDAFLEPYRRGTEELARLDTRLLEWSASDPQLDDAVRRLRAAGQRWSTDFAVPVLASPPPVGATAELSGLLAAGKVAFDAYRAVELEVRAALHDRRDSAGTQQSAALLTGAGVALLAALAAGLVVRRSNRRLAEQVLPPVQQVRAALSALTAGDTDRRAVVTGPVEFRQMAADVNELGLALQERSERVAVRERDLVAARDQAERAGHAKTAFLATMSHEIRTPLNAVLGLTDLLLTTDLTPEQRGHLETVSRSGDSLLTLINDVLDFSKIEAGELDLELAPFDLRDLVYDVAHLFTAQAAGTGVDLLVDVDATRSWQVVGDGPRLRQVVLNLVSNALKFTSIGQVLLSLSGTVTDGRVAVRIAVSDTGIGIPAEGMSRLFRSFSQVDDTATRSYGGTGLGLAISQRITMAMGGGISVDSRVGVGSVFTVALDLAVAPVETAPETTVTLVGRRVLVVDDNPTNLRILEHQLGRFGASCVVASSAAEALEQVAAGEARGERLDLAVLDQHMPEVDGDELARRLRQRPGCAALPLVLLSSSTVHVRDDGRLFAARLHKPVRPDRLLHTAGTVLSALPAHSGPHRSGGAPGGGHAPGGRLRVLVAEDHEVNAHLIALYLDQLGHEGVRVHDGRQAVDAVARGRFDVVLMDAQMPVLGGVEATAAIRALPVPQPRVIAVTASALASDRTAFFAAGADDFLSKPVRLRTLGDALSSVPATVTTAVPDPRPAPDAPALDGEVVEEMRDLGEDGFRAVYHRYADTLDASVAAVVAAVDAALGPEEEGSLSRLAHRLKGSSASLGATRLAELCARLEESGREPADGLARTVAELRAESRRVGTALDALLAAPLPAGSDR